MMADSNQAYLDDVRAMATDLWDLEFQAEANESHPKWNEVNDFVYAYDIAFPIAKLVALNYIDFETLTAKAMEEISDTWSIAMENGFFNGVWE
jgi:hypothetical protein